MILKEKTLLVSVKQKTKKGGWPLADMQDELEELVGACSAEITDHVTCIYEKPTPNFFIGRGKAEEISFLSDELGVDSVIFGCDLSGTQQRNLENVISKKTIDRTQLILDIFARRARSPEGKMQVELAQLEYMLPRLIGKGIILSRLGGGIGTRGPGEQKLEVDRRTIRKRIEKLKQDLTHVSLHRAVMRKKRQEKAMPSIALVGYTNAGKSTLLNNLTGASQFVSDSLFTTLDPLSKAAILPDGEQVIVSDTVGFLHELPHHLIEAFKATLEEVINSGLLLHVVDISHPKAYEYYSSVLGVLKDLGAGDKPVITVLNKVDLLEDKSWIERLKAEYFNPVVISALKDQNIAGLLEMIEAHFSANMISAEVNLPLSRMDMVNLFYKEGKITDIIYHPNGIKIKLNLARNLFDKLMHDKELRKTIRISKKNN
ncbi:MAG: GTPase HflX [Candidatus Omnitrophica bacterium]|nr:GTPase HflX [Candidatus Omnitrophota bacterium]